MILLDLLDLFIGQIGASRSMSSSEQCPGALGLELDLLEAGIGRGTDGLGQALLSRDLELIPCVSRAAVALLLLFSGVNLPATFPASTALVTAALVTTLVRSGSTIPAGLGIRVQLHSAPA